MLLTLKPPNQNDFKSPHDYLSLDNSSSKYSPPPTIRSAGSFSETFDSRMSNPHRGLPPPAAMTLPPPTSNLPAIAPLGQLPAPPSQWAGAEESMRNWLHAKAEEEKTKQETMKLDQCRIYQNMLRESLQGGIPPVMVPLIFAGMGGGNLSNQSLEWAQHYMAQMSLQQSQQQAQQQQQQQIQQAQQQQQQQQHQQQQQQQQQHSLPPDDIRRENRMVPPIVYPSHQQIQPAITASAGQMPSQATQPAFGRQVAVPKTASSGSLSRLNTNEMQIQKPPTGPLPFAQGADPLQVAQQESRETQSSPVIYFHHWVPPTKDTANPSTPSTRSQHNSPFSQNAASHLRSEHQNSPKKRKATGGHQAPPAPSNPNESSPLFSQASSRDRESPHNHQRGRRRDSRPGSNGSSTRGFEGQPMARPSRQHRPDQGGEDESQRSNRRAGESSASTSGDERRMRIRAAESETGQSRYQAGPEMREKRVR